MARTGRDVSSGRNEGLICVRRLYSIAMTETTIYARDGKADESDKEASIQTASDETGDTDMYGVMSRDVADQLGEYFTLTLTDDSDDVQLEQVDETKNFLKFETPGQQVYGVGIARDLLNDVFGEEASSVGVQFAPSDEEAYQAQVDEIEDAADEEAEALVVGGDADDGSDSSESDDEAENLVEISDGEISDDELGLD